jgi:hypothetical protein
LVWKVDNIDKKYLPLLNDRDKNGTHSREETKSVDTQTDDLPNNNTWDSSSVISLGTSLSSEILEAEVQDLRKKLEESLSVNSQQQKEIENLRKSSNVSLTDSAKVEISELKNQIVAANQEVLDKDSRIYDLEEKLKEAMEKLARYQVSPFKRSSSPNRSDEEMWKRKYETVCKEKDKLMKLLQKSEQRMTKFAKNVEQMKLDIFKAEDELYGLAASDSAPPSPAPAKRTITTATRASPSKEEPKIQALQPSALEVLPAEETKTVGSPFVLPLAAKGSFSNQPTFLMTSNSFNLTHMLHTLRGTKGEPIQRTSAQSQLLKRKHQPAGPFDFFSGWGHQTLD